MTGEKFDFLEVCICGNMWQVVCEFSFCRSEGYVVPYQTFGQI